MARTSIGDGDVVGPDSATDNAIVRFDGTDGDMVKNSGVTIDDSANMAGANEITITNGSNSDLNVYQNIVINSGTGLAEGGILSTGAGNDEFSISDGFGYIVNSYTDLDNATFIKVAWTGLTNITILNPANVLNFVYIDSSGTVVQQATNFTLEQRRNFIVLGIIISANTVDVTDVTQLSDSVVDVSHTLSDLLEAIGNINLSGNAFSAAATDLTITKSLGLSFLRSSNLSINLKNPNNITSALISTATLVQVFSDGSGGINTIVGQTDIDPLQFDDGSGTLASVPNNQWTNQRIFFFPIANDVVVQYGQNTFSNQSDAIAAVDSEDFVFFPSDGGQSLRTTLSIKKEVTDLSLSTEATFTNTGKFGFGI